MAKRLAESPANVTVPPPAKRINVTPTGGNEHAQQAQSAPVTPTTESDSGNSNSNPFSANSDAKSDEGKYGFTLPEELAVLGFEHKNISSMTQGKFGSNIKKLAVDRATQNLLHPPSLETLKVLIELRFKPANISCALERRHYRIEQLTECLDNIKVLVNGGVKPQAITSHLNKYASKADEDFKDAIAQLIKQNNLTLQEFSKPKPIPYPNLGKGGGWSHSNSSKKSSAATKKGAKPQTKSRDEEEKKALKYGFELPKELEALGFKHQNLSNMTQGKVGSPDKQRAVDRG